MEIYGDSDVIMENWQKLSFNYYQIPFFSVPLYSTIPREWGPAKLASRLVPNIIRAQKSSKTNANFGSSSAETLAFFYRPNSFKSPLVSGPRQANLCLQAFRHDKFQLRMPSYSEGLGIWLSVWRFWRDCADAQARLNLRCSHRR